MPQFNILTWNSETSVSPYPLEKSIGVDNLIIDANFVQFDDFVPILKNVSVSNDTFLITIQFDQVLKTISIEKSLLTGAAYTVVIRDGVRYLGKLVLGPEAANIYQDLVNKTLVQNVRFLSIVVRSIPSNAGVYSIAKLFGDLEFVATDNVSYAVDGQDVTIDAISIPAEISSYLKTINSIGPVNNNIALKDSETVKISIGSSSTVVFSLVGNSASNLIVEQNNTIPTNQNPA
jgi:hypothetical protein